MSACASERLRAVSANATGDHEGQCRCGEWRAYTRLRREADAGAVVGMHQGRCSLSRHASTTTIV
eukprot:14870207-Heterocapsa_arctica.AAC.1